MTAVGELSCDGCLAHSWLVARLSGHLDRVRGRIDAVLALGDEELIAAVGGRRRESLAREFLRLDVEGVRERARAAGLETICRCHAAYPRALRALASRPAVLHVAGGVDGFLRLTGQDPVAVVGSRRASPYGVDVARALGRALARAGVTVVAGMAVGVDAAAHAAALEAAGPTVAVLPGPANRAYPAACRALHRRIVDEGAAVSELPPGTAVRRWTFRARNRIIAGLATMTVVVEAGQRSGALVTARCAREVGRPVGAVPGPITSPQAAGTNALLADGATVVRGPEDVLECLFGAGAPGIVADERDELSPELRDVLAAVAAGRDTAGALTRAGMPAERGLAALAELELAGYLARSPGGRFRILP